MTATLRGEVVAEAYNNAASPDHHIQVYLNDSERSQSLVDLTWDGKSRFRFEAQVPQSQLVDGVNQLDFVGIKTAGMSFDKLYFDWYEIEYDRQYQADGDQLPFSGDITGTWKYKIEGFDSENIIILDITYPLTPTLVVSSTLAAGTVSFEITHDAGAQFFAGKSINIINSQISLYTQPEFSTEADYIFITHPDLMTATRVLANYRESQGLTTLVRIM
ncbi:MAG TPA: hypothetical protein ENI27_02630 [bacterium]|nr:hypothetical protein [bacterium]